MQFCGTFSYLFYICLFLQVIFPKPANRNEGVVMEVCISSLVCLAVCRGVEPKTCKPLLNRSCPICFCQCFLHEGFSLPET